MGCYFGAIGFIGRHDQLFLHQIIGAFANRYKEISLRNTLGSTYWGLFILLFLEQAVIILICGIITLAITESLLPWFISTFSNEIQRNLYIDIHRLWVYECQYIGGLLLISLLISFISSWHIAHKTIAQGLRGGTTTRTTSHNP